MQKILSVSLLFSLVSSTLYGNVSIVSTSYREQVQVNESGEKVKVWIHTEKVIPGTIIKYVNRLDNDNESTRRNFVIRSTIPKNMIYIDNSAQCTSSCAVRYSVDGGMTFHYPSKLYVKKAGKHHLAKASDYTNIRWRLDLLEKNSLNSVEYKARLK